MVEIMEAMERLAKMVLLMDLRDKAFDRMSFNAEMLAKDQLQHMELKEPKLYREAERLYLDSVEGAGGSEYVRGTLLELLTTAVMRAGK